MKYSAKLTTIISITKITLTVIFVSATTNGQIIDKISETSQIADIYGEGMRYFENELFDSALITFQNLLRSAPVTAKPEYFALCHRWIGRTYSKLQDTNLALLHLKTALEYDPNDDDANFYAGEILISQGKYKEAQSYFEHLISLNDDDYYSWFYLGVCHQQLKNYQKAIDIYEEQVLRLDPNNTDALTNLAFIYNKLEDYEKAHQYLLKRETIREKEQ